MEKSSKAGGGRRRMILTAAAAAAAVVVAVVLAVPCILPLVPLPAVEIDLTPWLPTNAAALVRHRKITADLKIERGEEGGMRVRADGRLLDWPFSARSDVRLGLSDLRMRGSLTLSLSGTDWRLDADFDAGSARDWRFSAHVPETRFAHDDAILGALLPRLGTTSVSNLACSGSLSVSAEGSCSPGRPAPEWSLRGTVRDVDAEMMWNDALLRVDNLRLRLGANGLADHCDIAPVFPRADSVEAAGIVMSNVFANIIATSRSLLVTEAGADCAGGELRLYSLFLDPERLSAGATVYVDGVDAGKVLAHVSGFRGEASGKLHGKLPFFIRNGSELRFRNSYLFSTPGETGNIRISDAKPLLDNLEAGGVSEDVRDNLARALANLDYTLLRIELRRGENGSGSALGMKLRGTATHGRTTVPVDVRVIFRGDLEHLVNTGIRLSGRQHK